MKCPKCNKKMLLEKATMDTIPYEKYVCSCGESILDMQQLKKLSQEHKKMREAKEVLFSQWGNSLAVRIPKSLAQELNIKKGQNAHIIKDKEGIRIIL